MGVWSCVFVILLSFISFGNSLECFQCNVTVSAGYSDPCKGIGSVRRCQDPAVCLSATYSFQEHFQGVKQYTTFKTCYGYMAGKECEEFLKNIKNTSPPNAKIEFTENEKCFTCKERGCNEISAQQSSTSIISVMPSCVLFVTLIGSFIRNPLMY